MRALAAWILLGLALSGCSDGGQGSGGPGAQGAAEETLAPQFATLRNGLAAPLHETIWANGSFAPHETCITGGCITQDGPGFHRIAVEVPRDVPVRIGVDLAFSASAASEVFGGLDAWLEVDATFYRHSVDRAQGQVRVDATLLPTTDVNVVVAAYNPTGEAPEIPYALHITVDAESEIVTPGVPVGVELGPGDEVRLDAPNEATTTFLLYAPNDALVGSFEDNHTVPADAAEGKYVVLIPPGAPEANITTDSGATSMDTLGLSFVNGATAVLPRTGTYDAEMEVAGYPLAVGWVAQSAPGSNTIGLMASVGFTVVLTGPNGIELDSGPICGLCVTGQWGFGMTTESGDPRVAAGTYLLHAETDATSEVEVTPYAIYIQRFG